MNAKRNDDEDEAFLEAFDRREMARIEASLNVRVHSSVSAAERDRVRAILDRDRADQNREAYRRQAEQQVANGDFSNFADTVIEPTPEWLEKGDTQPFTPKQPEGTVRVVKSVRRVVTPIVMRLWHRDMISDEQMKACLWFRSVFDQTGLEGRYSKARYGNSATLGSAKDKRNGGAAGQLPMTEGEFYARQQFRSARAAIDPTRREFFEAIVLHDVPLRLAARKAKCRNSLVLGLFKSQAQALVRHCDAEQVDIKGMRD